MKQIFFLSIFLFFFSCQSDSDPVFTDDRTIEEKIIDSVLVMAGTAEIDEHDISFLLKKKPANLSNNNSEIEARVLIENKKIQSKVGYTISELISSGDNFFKEENSILNFALFPVQLNLDSLSTGYSGEEMYNNVNYLKVVIEEEGSGIKRRNKFIFWINSITYRIDFLAYNNGAKNKDIRFWRSKNHRVINGISFRDYEIFKAKENTDSLEYSLQLFIDKKLLPLSEIVIENIIISNR